MRQLKTILVLAIISFVAISCSDNDTAVVKPVEAKSVENLHAPAGGFGGKYTGPFAKFSFKKGTIVTDDSWDIAFRATEIIVNGGVKGKLLEDIDRTGNASMDLVSGAFSKIDMAPNTLKQDAADALAVATGSGNGWYTYAGPPSHAITATAGKVFIIKTIDGNYAKMEILSYNKDKDLSKDSRYYSFNYVYNPNVGDKSLK
ncbi:HmuY family protein [Tenacibaculum aiptasiae]|uniref:HmuY family protein n=1 Tax=Tenacibaculum aiptasiae TaxID=426481 RepID=UPI00232B077C|nr:HmuY family protein [Tenacibaculum aiptasiae]